MKTELRRLLAFAAVMFGCLVFFAPSPAHADDNAERADDLKKRGDAAMDALKYTEAIQLYGEAYALTKSPAVLYNMGRAHEALGHYPEALDNLNAFTQQASPELRARVPGLAQRVADVRSHVSTLTLKASVAGARVVLSKKEVGTSPLPGPIKTTAGHATLEVVAEGYRPFRQELDLVGGREITLEVTLLSKNTSGVLLVSSPVVGAEVMVDGKDAGTVPVEVVVRAGSHPLVVTKAGYENSNTSVVVAVDERKSVSIPLEKKAPVTARWWFWTGVGVVVLAGAATTYALLTERKADSGTYPPGQVAGPLKIQF